jgi:hypothetical protein
MTYKAFQDWYKEASIKHLIIKEYKGNLVSPPFATELCKNYSTFKILNDCDIILDLPPSTSKTNVCEIINNDIWMIPYGIWDDLNRIVQIKDNIPIYHDIYVKGKGQFYSLASNGETGFSFPLGYEDTNFAIYINNGVNLINIPVKGKKLHMGTVYCNGSYWSMPRGDDPGYNLILEFDGTQVNSYPIEGIDNSITRKYTDIIVAGDTLYALPFGETAGLNEVVEFNTNTKELKLHNTQCKDFSKKYNCGVLIGDKIIAVPYGEDYNDDSNWGLIFDTKTKKSTNFDIGIKFGGKYRFRSGVAFNSHAVFVPAGTPSCPILKINDEGKILKEVYLREYLLGRPIIQNDKLKVIGYHIENKTHHLLEFDENLNYSIHSNIM